MRTDARNPYETSLSNMRLPCNQVSVGLNSGVAHAEMGYLRGDIGMRGPHIVVGESALPLAIRHGCERVTL